MVKLPSTRWSVASMVLTSSIYLTTDAVRLQKRVAHSCCNDYWLIPQLRAFSFSDNSYKYRIVVWKLIYRYVLIESSRALLLMALFHVLFIKESIKFPFYRDMGGYEGLEI